MASELSEGVRTFSQSMEQCLHLIRESSTTRSVVASEQGQALWKPPEGTIARLYFNRGWRTAANRVQNDVTAKLTRSAPICFATRQEEMAFMQIMKSNLLSMWVSWEAFVYQVPRGAFLDLIANLEKTISTNGSADAIKEEPWSLLVKCIVDRPNAAVEDNWLELKVAMVDHCICPFGKQRRPFRVDLSNITEERMVLFTGKNKADTPVALSPIPGFKFKLQLKVHNPEDRPNLTATTVQIVDEAGACLFLRFFYGLRNILSHGNPESTFKGCFLEFVKETGFKSGSKSDAAVLGKIQETILRLLQLYNCSVDAPARLDDVALWMAKKIDEFDRFRNCVRISTLLLEAQYGFLMALSKSYVCGLVSDIQILGYQIDASNVPIDTSI